MPFSISLCTSLHTTATLGPKKVLKEQWKSPMLQMTRIYLSFTSWAACSHRFTFKLLKLLKILFSPAHPCCLLLSPLEVSASSLSTRWEVLFPTSLWKPPTPHGQTSAPEVPLLFPVSQSASFHSWGLPFCKASSLTCSLTPCDWLGGQAMPSGLPKSTAGTSC